MIKEIRIGDILIKDWWLWSQVRVSKENCPECRSADTIIIHKGKELSQIIKVLQKMNYKGIKKKQRGRE